MRDLLSFLPIPVAGTLLAGGLAVGNGALTVIGMLLLGLFTVVGFTGLRKLGGRFADLGVSSVTRSFLVPFLGMGLISGSGVLLLGGLVWDNGLLTVLGMLLIAILLVGSLRPRRIPRSSKVDGNNKIFFPVTSVLLVGFAGMLIAFGLQQQVGILTVIGMLATGLFTVFGIAKAGRYV